MAGCYFNWSNGVQKMDEEEVIQDWGYIASDVNVQAFRPVIFPLLLAIIYIYTNEK